MITALSGTSRLRNTAISSRKLSTSTAPMKIGSRADEPLRHVDARRGEPADVHLRRRSRAPPSGITSSRRVCHEVGGALPTAASSAGSRG